MARRSPVLEKTSTRSLIGAGMVDFSVERLPPLSAHALRFRKRQEWIQKRRSPSSSLGTNLHVGNLQTVRPDRATGAITHAVCFGGGNSFGEIYFVGCGDPHLMLDSSAGANTAPMPVIRLPLGRFQLRWSVHTGMIKPDWRDSLWYRLCELA
jgi:hypothetical protein